MMAATARSAGWSIRPARAEDENAWLALRIALWPEEGAAQMQGDIPRMLGAPQRFAAFVAIDDVGVPIAFAEASLRRDYVNGTVSSPVGFLEAWYVAPQWHKRGIGRALIDAVAQWARARGCAEFASDALLDNDDSHAAHRACGFAETERVVYFRKALD
jgi:aminoglycoside 6'-N-acetyltransferase I